MRIGLMNAGLSQTSLTCSWAASLLVKDRLGLTTVACLLLVLDAS